MSNRSSGRSFHGRLVCHEIGPLQVLHLSADASAARRTARLIAVSDPETVQLMLQIRGACAITQEDRSSVIPAGSLGGWHSSSPYEVASEKAFQILIVTCPSVLLGPDADRVRGHTARRIDGSTGVGHIVKQHLVTLSRVLAGPACSERARGHLAEGLFDLIRALHADVQVSDVERRSQRMRGQVDRYIDEHLASPQLDRESIATNNFLSLRSLDRLYREDTRGVAATIRAKRLDRARRDLADAALADQSIFTIALRWGFRDPAHFSRAFGATYGLSPSAYRASAGAGTIPARLSGSGATCGGSDGAGALLGL